MAVLTAEDLSVPTSLSVTSDPMTGDSGSLPNCPICAAAVSPDAVLVAREAHALAVRPGDLGLSCSATLIVAPLAHSDLQHASTVAFATTMGLVRRMTKALDRVTHPEGMIMSIASGTSACCEAEHFHVAILAEAGHAADPDDVGAAVAREYRALRGGSGNRRSID